MTADRELIRRSIQHDHEAFAELFDRHGVALFRYAFGLSHNPDDAQDLVQETFITAWKRLVDIRLVGDSMLPWLIVTCRNHAANLRRSKTIRATVPIGEHDGALRDDDPGFARLERLEELAWVFRAVDELGDTDRRIVEMCLVEGRDYHEAAALLDLSVGAVTQRVHRTRTQLREKRSLREREVSA